jgi:hypothetical protein
MEGLCFLWQATHSFDSFDNSAIGNGDVVAAIAGFRNTRSNAVTDKSHVLCFISLTPLIKWDLINNWISE